MPQTLRGGKKETVPVRESRLKCRQERDAFLFLWGYKSRRCPKKTSGPFRLSSKKLGEESGVLNNQSEQLSSVSLKDLSISGNFESHLKQNFKTKEGTNKAQLHGLRTATVPLQVEHYTLSAVCSPFFGSGHRSGSRDVLPGEAATPAVYLIMILHQPC